jgi:hypothetical protein
MKRRPNHDPERNTAPRIQQERICLTCGKRLERKRNGRAPRYCSARCRDKAREARTFAAYGVARLRGGELDTPLGVPGMGDNAIPRNALAGGSAPLDVIGHSSHRFDTAPRLDPAVVRAILKSELPPERPP